MRLTAVVLFVMMLGGCTGSSDAPLRFEEAWIRQPVPGTEKSVGYFEIINNTPADITFTNARADNIRKIEFHTMTMDGDMMRMRRLSEFLVPAGERVVFVSGGKHLMMFGVGELGESVTVTFSSDDGVEYSHQFAVRAPVANN